MVLGLGFECACVRVCVARHETAAETGPVVDLLFMLRIDTGKCERASGLHLSDMTANSSTGQAFPHFLPVSIEGALVQM